MAEFHSSKRTQGDRLAYFGGPRFWIHEVAGAADEAEAAASASAAGRTCGRRSPESLSARRARRRSPRPPHPHSSVITGAGAAAVIGSRNYSGTFRRWRRSSPQRSAGICTERRELPTRQDPRRQGRQCDTRGHQRRGGGHEGGLWS